eukprot:6231614-Amphidinium_carterae.1
MSTGTHVTAIQTKTPVDDFGSAQSSLRFSLMLLLSRAVEIKYRLLRCSHDRACFTPLAVPYQLSCLGDCLELIGKTRSSFDMGQH